MQLMNLFDYEALAAQRMAHIPWAWDYYQGGSDDEVTLRANRAAFERLRLRPRVLVDVSMCDLRTSVLGTAVSMPILVAPTAGHGLAHPEAECATARAVRRAETLMIASTDSTRSLEEIAQAAQGPCWFQLYVESFRQAERLVRRAEAAGYQALVLTVDAPRRGHRERDLRNDLGKQLAAIYPAVGSGNQALLTGESEHGHEEEPDPIAALTWETVSWLRSITALPVLLKGILTAEDARLALDYGAAGIVVSNHGGRQLDGAVATMEALPEVVEAVAGRCEVYVDGGIRRGTDVLKALAVGARAVLLGRPILWGLAVDGEEGVYHVLHVLRAELDLAMALSGCPTLESITRALIT
ncbi:MAG TPA: alpha-hydroxy acid oxidase [Ktedonobacterales bacterium]|nr:alpha-hydroxy acid oxidase [Ktedonobacterales bacterium]